MDTRAPERTDTIRGKASPLEPNLAFIGVRGIRLREGDYVVGAARAVPGKNVLTITELGYGKQTPVEEYRKIGRAHV